MKQATLAVAVIHDDIVIDISTSIIIIIYVHVFAFSALMLWLGILKRIWLENSSDGVSVWSEVQIVGIWSILYDAIAIPKPRHLLPHLYPDWFYLSGTSLPRLSWKRRC